MPASRFFLLSIYSLFALQIMAALQVYWPSGGWRDISGTGADGIVLLLADWVAFVLMAHRHARRGDFHFSRPAQLLGVLLLVLACVRLFTCAQRMTSGVVLVSYLGMAGCYLLFSRLRDLPRFVPEALVAGFALLRISFIPDVVDGLLGITRATVEIGSWFLYLMGHPTLVNGNTIVTDMGAVVMNWPCTGLYTAGGLLAIATALAFCRPWSREAKIGLFLAALLLSFLAGCFRVVVMSYSVSSVEAFKYWHGVYGFLIFAGVTYSLFGLAVWRASKTTGAETMPASPSPALPGTPWLVKIPVLALAALVLAGWARWGLLPSRAWDFPYPDLAAALPVQDPRLAPNPDPYAESSWGRALFLNLPEGRLMLAFRPGQGFIAIRDIFRNLQRNTPTKWNTVTVPEGSVAWRVQDGNLELAALVHRTGRLTVTGEEYNEEFFKGKLTPNSFFRWFVGRGWIKDARTVLIHLTVPGGQEAQVQGLLPIVIQVARLTAASF